MNEIEFSETVRAICKHPRMYTPYGTLAEVVAYLEGYARAKGLADAHWGLSDFNQWLAKHLGFKELGVRWEEMLDCRDSSEETMNRFAELYQTYAEGVSSAKMNDEAQAKRAHDSRANGR